MKTNIEIKKIAQKVIIAEATEIKKMATFIDDDFASIVNIIFNSNGRIIITGIGKSAIIANKIVATLNSTGTPAIFMHAADAIHGDLGIIQKEDIVICISKSGNTPEIKVLVPLIKNLGNVLIGMIGHQKSFLTDNADYVLKAIISQEACPNNLAPTTSTTAQLVIGDALAICLLECRQFSSNDFAKYHPGGALGKKLYLRVNDLLNDIPPVVYEHESIKKVIIEISSKRMGATAVIDKNNHLVGIITDGDLRRMLEKGSIGTGVTAQEIMTRNPKIISNKKFAIEAFNIMEQNEITQLIITENKQYIGMIHLHDILKEGIV